MTDVRSYFTARRTAAKPQPAVLQEDLSGCYVGSAEWLAELQEEQIREAQQCLDDEPESTELPWWYGEYESDPHEDEDEDVKDFYDTEDENDDQDDVG